MFIACHPVLSREAQVALTLRVLGGLTSDEIARAFLVPTATVQARITRAKKTLAAAQVPFEVPPPDERRKRLGSVLSVLYLIFTEGSTATSGREWIRPDLAREAVRLTRILARLVPGRAGGARPARAARAHRRPVPGARGRRRRTGPARGAGPPALGPGGDPARAGGAGPGRAGRPRSRRVRRAGRDRRVPRGRAVRRGDGLGTDRAALRGARPAGALARRRAQPGGRDLDGPGPGSRAAGRRRAGRGGRPLRLSPAAERARRAAQPPRPDPTRRGASSSSPSGSAGTSASAACSSASSPPWADTHRTPIRGTSSNGARGLRRIVGRCDQLDTLDDESASQRCRKPRRMITN